jgi:Zn-dependent protease with chaperone function
MSFPKVEIRRRPSMALFAVSAIAMVIGSYLFVLLLAAACVYLPYLILANSDSFSPQIGLLFLFGIVIAGAMLWSLIPRRDRFQAPGMLLDRATQPRLFAELESIASALNETLPSEVYLIGAPNAFVADRGGVMGFGSRRIMGLGLPLISLLTVSQFRAVLAHEFAHYYGGDTSLGPWVYKTKSSIVRIFENIGSVGELARIAILGVMYMVVATLLKGYFIAFLRVINLISRKQEYRADELACLVAGRQNLIDGLQAIHRAAVAWNFYWNNEVAPPLNDGCLVAVGDGFQRFIAVPDVSSAISKDLSKRLQEEKTKPYDTHPPLRDRIAAAEKLSEGSAPQDAQPASTLLQNLPATELKFVEACIPDTRPGSLQYVGWDDVVSRVRIPAWQKFVNEYSEPLQGVTAESVPDHMDKFREIGSRIRDPKGILLSPPQRTARAGGLFASALALAMIRAGWELQVAPAVFRIHRGGQEFNPFDAINQLMAGKLSRENWVARCREFGISELLLLPNSVESSQAAGPQQTELFEAPKT